MEPTTIKEWKTLAASMRKTLAQNLTAALMVAGGDSKEIGNPIRKMKLADLYRKTDIARSTLSKLTSSNTTNTTQANPDLETICRLAAALNLPPAFLLMSVDDWQRLLGALNGLQSALSSPHLDYATLVVTGNDKVSLGLKLAEKMGLYSNHIRFKLSVEEGGARQAEMDRDIEHQNEMKRLAILTTTAVTQSSARNRDDIAMLTAIGAIFGANFKSI